MALDVGNTTTLWGLFDGARMVCSWRTSTSTQATEDELAVLLEGLLRHAGYGFMEIDRVAIASVVPPLMPVLERLCRRYLGLEPFIVGPQTEIGMPVDYEHPEEIGADRLMVALAAYHKYGGPVIVVDFGTALLLDVVSANGTYLGGLVLPGVETSVDALFQKAARLPRIEIASPPRAIATNTVHALQSGIVYGFAGQVDALVERICQETGPGTRVIATGDMAPRIAPCSRTIQQVDPLLPLEGLVRAAC